MMQMHSAERETLLQITSSQTMAAFLMAFELNLYFQVEKVKKKNRQFLTCRILILVFSVKFYPIKIDMSGNTFWPKASGFPRTFLFIFN